MLCSLSILYVNKILIYFCVIQNFLKSLLKFDSFCFYSIFHFCFNALRRPHDLTADLDQLLAQRGQGPLYVRCWRATAATPHSLRRHERTMPRVARMGLNRAALRAGLKRVFIGRTSSHRSAIGHKRLRTGT